MTKDDWSKLRDVILTYADQQFAVVEPGGNRGDELIYIGMEKLLDGHDIEYNSYSMPQDRSEPVGMLKRMFNDAIRPVSPYLFDVPKLNSPDVILVQGGGNFNDFFPAGIYLLENLIVNYPDTPIIIGPQSVWTRTINLERVLARSSQPIHLFTREKFSYNHLQYLDIPSNVTVSMAPDTALYLKRRDLEEFLIEDNQLVRTNKPYELIGFRNDKTGAVSKDIIEQCKRESNAYIEEDISDADKFTFEEFITIAYNAEVVYTDRLHGAILGHVLENQVQMYDLAYFKNRAVYDYSLSQTDNVEFNKPY